MAGQTHIFEIALDDMVHLKKIGTRYGVPFITPELDDFDTESTYFDNAVCAVPVCGQSRWSKMTGFTPAQTGTTWNFPVQVLKARATDTITYHLRKAGYYTGYYGKVYDGRHADRNTNKYSADFAQGQINDDMSGGTSVDYGGAHGTVSLNDPNAYGDLQVVEWWEDFLANYNGTRPLANFMGLFRPHDDYVVPEEFYNLYDPASFVLPADLTANEIFVLPDDILNHELGRSTAVGTDLDPRTPEGADKLRRTLWGYYAAVSFTSHNFGRLLAAIKAMCARRGDDFYLAVWSDHGFHLGSHMTWHKLTTLSESANPPCWIRHPGQSTGRVVHSPVSFFDLFHTTLDYAGVPVPRRTVGQSLRPLVEGTGTIPECFSVTNVFGATTALLESDPATGLYQPGGTIYRVGEYVSGETVVFNDDTDWRNMTNIAGENATRTGNLLTRLRDMAVSAGYGYSNTPLGAARKNAVLGIGAAARAETMKLAGGNDNIYWSGDFADGSTGGEGIDILWYLYHDGQEFRLPAHVEYINEAASNFWAGNGTQKGFAKLFANNLDNVIKNGWGSIVLVEAGAGDDEVIYGNEVHGGFGNDDIQTQWMADTVTGGAGNDTIDAGVGNDLVHGNEGNDSIIAGGGADTVYGGDGDDTIDGGDGNDLIFGGKGENTLNGGAGNDTLVADAGSNTMSAGDGFDTFRILPTERLQVITDFASGEVLDLTALAHLGSAAVTSSGTTVTVSVGAERIELHNTTEAIVTDGITGISIAA